MDKQLTILLPNDVPLELILVESGYFIMGSEAEYTDGERKGSEHLVHITHPFFIGKYPVTQVQWQAVMGYNPSGFPGAQRPVEGVSWKDIVEGKQDDDSKPAFLTMVNIQLAKERPDISTTHEFCLPTEAEWEYAAKGGRDYFLEELRGKKASDLYPTYSGSDKLEACGWFNENTERETRPVGLKAPNKIGLYDMSGNVLEWCQDLYNKITFENRQDLTTVDPKGPAYGGSRVLRGGNYWNRAGLCKSAYRYRRKPVYRNGTFGFRLVLAPKSDSGTSG